MTGVGEEYRSPTSGTCHTGCQGYESDTTTTLFYR